MMRSSMTTRLGILSQLVLIACLSTGCATVQQLTNMQAPDLEVAGMRFTDLTFETIDLAFDVKVTNPNALAVKMAGFDYNLRIAEGSLLQGRQNQATTLTALGESHIEVPVQIRFADVYAAFASLLSEDRTPYEIDLGFSFDLPVLGTTRVPLSHSGLLPLIKLPNVSLAGLKVNELGLGGADLELAMQLDNPNSFGLLLNSLDYALDINGRTWAEGSESRAVNFGAGASRALGIPIHLDFAEMGTSLYELLSGDSQLQYQLRGDMDLKPSASDLPLGNLPLDSSGLLDILR